MREIPRDQNWRELVAFCWFFVNWIIFSVFWILWMLYLETLCSWASSKMCSLSMFVLVCRYLGWTYCKLVLGRSSNLSSFILPLAGICPRHSLGFPLCLPVLEFSPYFPAALIVPNSVLWGQEDYGFSVAFSFTVHCWFQPVLRLKAIKWVGHPMPFLSSECWLSSESTSFG